MNNTVEIAVRLALEQFKIAVTQLEAAFGGAMDKVEAEAAVAGGALDQAFRTLGVKSVASVNTEIQKLQVAIGIIRAMPGVLPADAERATQAFNARLTELKGSLGGVQNASGQASGAINQTSQALGSAAKQAAAWAAALVGVNSVTDLAKNVIATGSAFEQLEGRLTSLLGSQEASAAAFAQIKELAATTPFEVGALTEAYAKLTAFGLQPSMEQMMAMADTAASLGGGTQMLERVTLALGQAWTKGKLQGGEIMQMAEAGVPVWDLLAKATGKNVAELQRLSEEGRLGKDVIKALIDEMGRSNAGASATLMDTYAGAVSNAKDATAEFFDMIAKSGVLDYLKTQIQALLVEFDRMKQSGELEAKAKAIADAFLGFADATKTAFEALSALSGVIKIAIEAMVVTKLLSFAGAFRTLAIEAAAGGTAVATATTATTAAGAAAGTAAVSVGLLGRALGALKLLSLVGLAEGAMQLGAEFFRAKRHAEELDVKVAKMMEAKPALVVDQVNGLGDAIDSAKNKVTDFEGDFNVAFEKGKSTAAALRDAIGKIDFSSVKGVSDFLAGMDALRAKAKITAQEFEDGIGKSLEKLTAGQLREFGVMAKIAFDNGEASARALDAALNGALDASLKQIGITAKTSLGGMSEKFAETAKHTDLVIAGFDRLEAAGIDTGEVLRDALDTSLAAATSAQDFTALAATVRKLGEEGKLTKADMSDMLDSIAAKADAAAHGINSIAEAFKTLGLKTESELNKLATTAADAFEKIRTSGTAAPREIQAAFLAYAKTAIESNNGVATSTLKAQAAAIGMSKALGQLADANAQAERAARENIDAIDAQAQITELAYAADLRAADAKIRTARAALEKAEASGDEAAATEALNALTAAEIEKADTLVQAKQAVADAARAKADAVRAEAEADGMVTDAERVNIAQAEDYANSTWHEAQAAREAAGAIRDKAAALRDEASARRWLTDENGFALNSAGKTVNEQGGRSGWGDWNLQELRDAVAGRPVYENGNMISGIDQRAAQEEIDRRREQSRQEFRERQNALAAEVQARADAATDSRRDAVREPATTGARPAIGGFTRTVNINLAVGGDRAVPVAVAAGDEERLIRSLQFAGAVTRR